MRCQKGDRFSLVAIDERGVKRLRSGRTKLKLIMQYLPLLRGIVYFFVGTIALFATFFDAAKIACPARVKKSEPKSNLKNDSILALPPLVCDDWAEHEFCAEEFHYRNNKGGDFLFDLAHFALYPRHAGPV